MKFFDRLNESIDLNQSILCVSLEPDPDLWPQQLGTWDVALSNLWRVQEWLQFVIAETADLVCAYKLKLEFYRSLGSSGLELLRKTLAIVPTHIPIILDAQHADPHTSTIFARTIFSSWQVDAVMLNPLVGQDGVAPFLVYPDKAVFVRCASANFGNDLLKKYPTDRQSLYLTLVEEAKTWGPPEQVGLEVRENADVLANIRKIAPERLILVTDIANDVGNLEQILTAGFTANGDGLIIAVPMAILSGESPRQSLQSLRDRVNRSRAEIVQGNPTCSFWLPDVCLLQQHPHKDLILQLYDIGCIHFGEYVQSSGATFSYYIDLRTIISHPQVFEQVLSAYAEVLQTLTFDRIAGIPFGSLPTATGLGLRLNYPMLFPRKELKTHGTRRLVEGQFQPGETVVVVDDILITGKSVMEGAEKLQSAGLKVKDIVVLIDHEQGVKAKLQQNGYRGHAVVTISEIVTTLYEAGRLNTEQFQSFGLLETNNEYQF
jgi:uridine monophosphate synthetase